jgi:hypothetical protein
VAVMPSLKLELLYLQNNYPFHKQKNQLDGFQKKTQTKTKAKTK